MNFVLQLIITVLNVWENKYMNLVLLPCPRCGCRHGEKHENRKLCEITMNWVSLKSSLHMTKINFVGLCKSIFRLLK